MPCSIPNFIVSDLDMVSSLDYDCDDENPLLVRWVFTTFIVVEHIHSSSKPFLFWLKFQIHDP